MALDFTYLKYFDILEAISMSEYKTITISEYINSKTLPEKFIIIRHDVDLDPYYQVKFAETENKFGLKASYYFRYIPKVFNENIISRVKDLNHEVGFHYEVFTKAKGDVNKAIELFKSEQEIFSEKWGSETVCPHGGSFVNTTDAYSLGSIIKIIPKILSGKSVFSHHINFDMWDKYNFNDFGIIGDAYKSIDFSNILYLSDTGRSWKRKYKRLDNVDSNLNDKFNIKSSNDIIDIIKNKKVNQIYLLIHNEQWKDSFFSWVSWYIAQIIRRIGKRIVFGKY